MNAPRTTSLILASLLVPGTAWSQQERPHAYVPPNGFVPDSATAVRIAVAVWIPIYGEEQIRSEQPYIARLRGEVWTVTGSLPKATGGPRNMRSVGGVAVAEIAKHDARILRVSHGR